MCAPGASVDAIDPLGDPIVALLGSRYLGAGPPARSHVEYQINPCLQVASDDPARFAGVRVLGVDEHLWHPQDRRRRGPREFAEIVDLTRGQEHPTARLLDLVSKVAGIVYKNWVAERGEDFRAGVRIAILDPFPGYKNAIDDQLQDTTSVLDAFHIVKLAGDAQDEVRRRV